MKYRAEIDGLRAIAVVPVILFHAGFHLFSGGFVGVDVFFVISGYLITTIILSEKEQGKFSIVNFYERRARRILPVLFFIMALCLPFAWFLLLSSHFKDFSESLIAVSLFSSNILFWMEKGYWGAANELKPLLHTWSLAVEEQYYVLFPIFLMLVWRFKNHWRIALFSFLALVSFILAEWAAHHKPTANFFLLPTRWWELAIGAGIAIYFLYKKNEPRTFLAHKFVDEFAGLLGLSMIFYSVVAYNDYTPFPSAYALVPTVGTGLVVMFTSSHTIAGKLLSHKALVSIGLMSYSLYLWHQPLFAFTRHSFLFQPDKSVFSILIAVTFVLSYLSWKYVEAPFRNKAKFSRRFIFSFTVFGSLFFMGIGLIGTLNNGFDQRVTNSGITFHDLDANLDSNYGLSSKCEGSAGTFAECQTGQNPEILVWGDSFAMHLVEGIIASEPNVQLIQMTKTVCGPFLDVSPVHLPNYPVSWGNECLDFTDQVWTWIQNSHVKYIVMSSPFHQYIVNNYSLLYRSGELKEASLDNAVEAYLKTLQKIESIGITPVVFSPLPNNGTDIGQCLVRSELLDIDKDKCNFDAQNLPPHIVLTNQFLDKISQHHKVIRFDEYLCQDSECITHLDNTLIYRDFGHFSYEGSAKIGQKMNFYKLIVD